MNLPTNFKTWILELQNLENIKMASNVEIEPIEHDIEDSFDESNWFDNLELKLCPLFSLLGLFVCILYFIVETIKAGKPEYKL